MSAEGVVLHALDEGAGRPVVLLHGFTGSVETMAGVAEQLAAWRRVRIDLVGHGRSPTPADPAAYRMEACVDQVIAALDARDVGRAHLIGYSMGGRVALALCATIGVAFSANLFTLFLFYEALSLVTYPLVGHKKTAEAKAGARKYLIYLLGGITAYNVGVHRVTGIKPNTYEAAHWMVRQGSAKAGDTAPPTLSYTKVMDDEFNPPRARTKNSCGSHYCELVDKAFIAELQAEYEERLQNLRGLLNSRLCRPDGGRDGSGMSM